MRYFVWVDFQYEMLALFLGVVSVILVYMAWSSYPKGRVGRTGEELAERSGHERDSGHDYEKVPIAPFIIFIYAVTAVWSVSYLIFIVAGNRNF